MHHNCHGRQSRSSDGRRLQATKDVISRSSRCSTAEQCGHGCEYGSLGLRKGRNAHVCGAVHRLGEFTDFFIPLLFYLSWLHTSFSLNGSLRYYYRKELTLRTLLRLRSVQPERTDTFIGVSVRVLMRIAGAIDCQSCLLPCTPRRSSLCTQPYVSARASVTRLLECDDLHRNILESVRDSSSSSIRRATTAVGFPNIHQKDDTSTAAA